MRIYEKFSMKFKQDIHISGLIEKWGLITKPCAVKFPLMTPPRYIWIIHDS